MKTMSFLCALATATVATADEVSFYIGTYTSDEGSKGIYRATLDTRTGQISEPELAGEASGPSFVVLHPNGQFLYAVQEPGSAVVAFAVEEGGALRRLNEQPSHGRGPCHVSTDPAGKHVFVANYGGGSVACLPINDDGTLAPASSTFENSGRGPNERRQEGPHLHCIFADAEARFVYACDLGTDEVLVFRFDAGKGELVLNEPRSAKVPPGGGPRHLAIHPTGRFLFVNNELTSAVTAFERDPQRGSLRPLQTLSTLPEGETVPGNTTAAIFLHPTGKFLYVSNRGHDSIAVFTVADEGLLTPVEVVPTGVAIPRGFNIDPSGKWLIVGGQRSNDITALAIDPSTGKLTPGPNKISVGSPVCIEFVQ
jgi:6-phosphogluconolactonase